MKGRGMKTKTMSRSKIIESLHGYMDFDDATLNSDVVDSLYRQYHQLGEDVDTDLEVVEAWAVEILQKNVFAGK